jgi:hypothetical protein
MPTTFPFKASAVKCVWPLPVKVDPKSSSMLFTWCERRLKKKGGMKRERRKRYRGKRQREGEGGIPWICVSRLFLGLASFCLCVFVFVLSCLGIRKWESGDTFWRGLVQDRIRDVGRCPPSLLFYVLFPTSAKSTGLFIVGRVRTRQETNRQKTGNQNIKDKQRLEEDWERQTRTYTRETHSAR